MQTELSPKKEVECDSLIQSQVVQGIQGELHQKTELSPKKEVEECDSLIQSQAVQRKNVRKSFFFVCGFTENNIARLLVNEI